jgi:hypothetical protein
MARSFACVVWFDEVAWVAATLDHDMLSQGRTPQEALASLRRCIVASCRFSTNEGQPLWSGVEQNDSHPLSIAEMAKWRAMYEATELVLTDETVGVAGEIYRAPLEVQP